ncbi:MAG: hypothetical protein Q9M48_00585 [Rhodobacterales bacterium]|nr:hypothetical protein [Rhodobacterales bacterium]
MKRFLTVVLLALTWGSILQAEIVTLRSGEHADFTRLVLYLPRPLDWELETNENKSTLTIRDNNITFDLGAAFEKISRERVSSITPASKDSTLEIGLNCDCVVTSFLHENSMLVIDIGDSSSSESPEVMERSEAADPLFSETVSNPTRANSENPNNLEARYSDRHPYSFGQISSIASSQDREFYLGFGVALSATSPTSEAQATMDEERLARLKRVKDAELRLIEQIGRAATQGLLSVQQTQIEPVPSAENTGEIQSTEETVETAQTAQSESSMANVNLIAESSIDRSLLQTMGAMPQTRNGDACLSNEELAIETWGTTADFGAQLGQFRANLFGEFDQPNTEIASELAKLYLYFGFGAEARETLNLADITSRQKMLYLSLARIMEQKFDAIPGPLSDQLDCDTAAAFWSALASPEIPRSAEINISALLRTLNTIPIHLRIHLGPILSERLTLAGEPGAAASVLRVLNRGMEQPNSQIHMAEATLEMSEGNLEAASLSLDAVVTANTEFSPDALVNLIETLLTRGEAIPPKIADLAGAFAQERRDEPIGQDLRRVHILALADAARFVDAMQELERFKSDKSLSGYRELRSKTVQILAEKADDLTFLEFALYQSHETPDQIDPNTANFVADRLIQLGFSSPASNFILAPTEGAAGRDRRVLRARLALVERRPRRAEAELLGLEGPQVDKLRAQAQSMTGNHGRAQQFYASLDQAVPENSEAWLAEDWDHLATTENEIIAAAAQLMIAKKTINAGIASQALPEVPTKGVLAQNRDLLEASLAARETINALLGAMTVDPVPER